VIRTSSAGIAAKVHEVCVPASERYTIAANQVEPPNIAELIKRY